MYETTYGNQQFNPGMTLEEIVDCLQEWDKDNVRQFNILTRREKGRYILAPYSYDDEGVDVDVVKKMWQIVQTMDRAAYDYINSRIDMIDNPDGEMTGVLFVPPPPPPPPPPGGDQ